MWVAREYALYVFLRLVFAVYLLLLVAGGVLYWYFEDYLGWQYLTLEGKWTVFVCLVLGIAAVVGGLAYGVFLVVHRIWLGGE